MKSSTGIVRLLDELGRYVIPVETRRMLNIEVGDSIEFFFTDKTIVMRKYSASACIFCQNADELIVYKEKLLCQSCYNEVTQLSAPPRPLPELVTTTRKRYPEDVMLARLKEQLVARPQASQKELADLLGVSQGRISQLKKKLA